VNLKEKLDKIDVDIQNGLKHKSADRLRNLINLNPNDLELWNRLAELYYQSGFLASAGKYWILTPQTKDKIKQCVEIYEKSVNHSGNKILQDITYRGDKSKLSEYGKRKLSELEQDSKKNSKYVPTFSPILNKQKKKTKTTERTFSQRIIEILMIGLLISIPIFAIIGIYTTLKWLK